MRDSNDSLVCQDLYAVQLGKYDSEDHTLANGAVACLFGLLGLLSNGLLLYLNWAKGKVTGDFKYFFGNLSFCDFGLAVSALGSGLNFFVGCWIVEDRFDESGAMVGWLFINR
ncbi:MAG: hypothetical protein GY737_24855 [Desulfobacteraceae bacterium]|nr:hypothetical protein [Desulfobacteraceae bacterium]